MSDFERRLSEALQHDPGEHGAVAGLADAARRRARERRRRRRTTLGAVAVSAVVVAVVGGQWWSDRGAGTDLGPSNDGFASVDPVVTCRDGYAWPASAMSAAPGAESSEKEAGIRAAFADVLRQMPLDAPAAIRDDGAEDARYVVLLDRADELVVGVGDWNREGPAPGAAVMILTRRGAAWEATSWGDCSLAIATPAGQSRVDLSAPPTGVDATSRTITLLATEHECSSGRDVTPYLLAPEVVESDDQVSVRVTAEEVKGAANCIGNEPVEIEVELAEPLGDRQLLDGGTWPPTPVG